MLCGWPWPPSPRPYPHSTVLAAGRWGRGRRACDFALDLAPLTPSLCPLGARATGLCLRPGHAAGLGPFLVTLHPSPVTLHPSPFTRHPSPFTLHPSPVTRHPSPFTLHPSPFTLHPSPFTLHPSPFTPLRLALAVFWARPLSYALSARRRHSPQVFPFIIIESRASAACRSTLSSMMNEQSETFKGCIRSYEGASASASARFDDP
jgi:hypothetical protein